MSTGPHGRASRHDIIDKNHGPRSPTQNVILIWSVYQFDMTMESLVSIFLPLLMLIPSMNEETHNRCAHNFTHCPRKKLGMCAFRIPRGYGSKTQNVSSSQMRMMK
jgi:hypothetical protein